MTGVARTAGLGVACLCLLAVSGAADDLGSSGDLADRTASVWEVFPETGFYPVYIADPIRSQSAGMLIHMADSEVPDAGDARFALRLGGSFPIVAFRPGGDRDRGWQLDFEGGFAGQFDMDYSLDNIGWDGFYGLLLDYKPRPDLAFRFGALHDSAHLGDEYEERTGRRRVGYTREEIVLGVSWRASARWRFYFEGGRGYKAKEFQEPLRVQAGAECQGGRLWKRARGSWYAALDARAYEENDWDPRVTGQLGIAIPTGRGVSRYRFALEIANGRSVLGEFYASEETYAGLGVYFDF